MDLFGEVAADELGTWVHRLYQVYLMQPGLLSKALPLKQVDIDHDVLLQAVIMHLDGFKSHMEHLAGGVRKWDCELPVSALNLPGQVISGVVDLVVWGEAETLLVDHKSNRETSADRYWEQLAQYRYMSIGSDGATVLNWVRHGACHRRLSSQ